MGKVILEVPGAIDMNLKAQNYAEAIKKLTQLKRANNKHKKITKKFRGIAKYKQPVNSKDEWYYQ